MSPSKLTKYCACHAKWPSNIWQKFAKNSWNVISNARPIRDRSENDPNMIRSGSVSPQPATQQRLLFALRTNGLYWKIQHFALRLSFQISPSTAPTTKSNTSTSPSTAPTTKSDTWTSPSTAPTTQSDTWTSPSTAPTTKSDTWTSPQVLRLPRKVTLDLHQVLRLPHRMTRRLDPRHIWNVISNARRNKCHPPNSPNTAPATQNDHPTSGRNLRKTAETSFPMRGRSETVPRMIRTWSDQVPSVRNPPRNRGYFSRSGGTVCIEKYNISRSGYLSKSHQVLRLPRKVTLELHQVLRLPRKVTLELHQVLRLPRKVTLELHQVLRLPRKVTLELHQVLRLPRKVTLDLHQVLRLPRKVTLDLHQVLRLPHRMTRRLDPRHIWNVISNARSNKCHPPNSPHTAPATQNHHPTSGRNLRKTAETSFPMRGRSEHDPNTIRSRSETVPRPFPSVRNPPRNRGYFSRSGGTVCIEKYNISRSGYLSKSHQVLRLPRKVTLELHHKYCAYHEKWHLSFTKYCAYHEKWDLNFTKYCAHHAKWHLNFTKYCAHHAKWHLNFTKYCAHHAKWHLNFTKYCACHENCHLTFTNYCACFLRSDCTWLYYYAAILIDFTTTQRL